MYGMKRTTIFIDPSLERRARQQARREGKSFAAVVREALAAYVVERVPAKGALPSWVGMGDSGRSDIASHVDDFLWTDPHN